MSNRFNIKNNGFNIPCRVSVVLPTFLPWRTPETWPSWTLDMDVMIHIFIHWQAHILIFVAYLRRSPHTPFHRGVILGQTQLSLVTLIHGSSPLMDQGTGSRLIFNSLLYYQCPGESREDTIHLCDELHLYWSYEEASGKRVWSFSLIDLAHSVCWYLQLPK